MEKPKDYKQLDTFTAVHIKTYTFLFISLYLSDKIAEL